MTYLRGNENMITEKKSTKKKMMNRGYRAGHQGMQECASSSSTSGGGRQVPQQRAPAASRVVPGAGVEGSHEDVEMPDEVVEGGLGLVHEGGVAVGGEVGGVGGAGIGGGGGGGLHKFVEGVGK